MNTTPTPTRAANPVAVDASLLRRLTDELLDGRDVTQDDARGLLIALAVAGEGERVRGTGYSRTAHPVVTDDPDEGFLEGHLDLAFTDETGLVAVTVTTEPVPSSGPGRGIVAGQNPGDPVRKVGKNAVDAEIAPLARAASGQGNPVWGPLMRAGVDKSLFARQVERYAERAVAQLVGHLRGGINVPGDDDRQQPVFFPGLQKSPEILKKIH